MDGIHPKFVLSKRFPVHAAIEQLDLVSLSNLLTPASDARFHFGRKLTNTDVSVLHQACAARPHPQAAVLDIVKFCTALGAPVNDCDCIGQTPLFYAVSHCQGPDLVPVLLKAGVNVNKQRVSDGWTALHVAAMLGRMEVANLLLQAGADASLQDNFERTASQVAEMYSHRSVADCINSPREKFRPEFPTQYMEFLKSSAQEDNVTILYDEHCDWRDSGGASLLHVACWTGNIELFRAFCLDGKGRKLLALPTSAGLTPLMYAIINGQNTIVEEYFNNRSSKKDIYFHKVLRDTKQTLLFLLFLYCPGVSPKVVLKRKDLSSEVVNVKDNKGNTALMACCLADCRDTVRRLLSSKAATERHLFDLSIKNVYDKTVLHLLVLNNDKYNVRLALNLMEDAGDSINTLDCNDMTPLMYAYTREYFEVADAIINHPKAKSKIIWTKMDSKGRTISQLEEEATKKRAEMEIHIEPIAPAVVSKPTPKRNFQQEMNDIYKASQEGKEKKENAPNPANGLKKQEPVKPKEISKPKEEPKTTNGVHVNGNSVEANGKEEPEDGPSLADIRNQWKKKKPEPEKKMAEEFNTESFLEDMLKKAEEKANESKSLYDSTPQDDDLTESMNEEISWALQQKREHAENNESPGTKRRKEEEEAEKEKQIRKEKESQEKQMEKLKLQKEKEEKEKAKVAQVSEQERMANLVKAMEKKSEAKVAAREKRLEPERKRQEEMEIQEAMSEEIAWALEQKREAAEEEKRKQELVKQDKLKEEEDKRVMNGIQERKNAKEAKIAEELERKKRIEEEKDKLISLQKEAEQKILKAKEAQALKAQQTTEEEDSSLAKLPRWKREKVLKEREAKAKLAKLAKSPEEELQDRLTEEIEWAENLKNQEAASNIPEQPVTPDDSSQKIKEEEKRRLEQIEIEAKKKAQEEKENIKAIEKEKHPTQEDLEKRMREDQEIQAAMSEEIEWALEQKRQLREEQETKEEREKEMKRVQELKEEEDRKIMKGISERKKVKEEKEKAEKENQRKLTAENIKEEKKKMEELEKKALEKIEEAKRAAEKRNQEQLQKEKEKKKMEEEERKRNMEEDLRWAEEARLQEEADKRERERKEREKIEADRKAAEDAVREEQRQKRIKEEKEMLEKLANAAAEKLRVQKEEEELKVKAEKEAWEKMPKWKKDKILRDRKNSSAGVSSVDNSRKSSLVDSSPDSPKTESPKVENSKIQKSNIEIFETKTDTAEWEPEPEPELAKPEVEPAKPEVKPAKSEVEPDKPEVEPAKPEVEPAKPEVEPLKIDISAIWNDSIEANQNNSSNEDISKVLSLAQTVSPGTPEEVEGTDKFCQWLKKELKQTEESSATENDLKPPAPVPRRRRGTGQEETEEAVRPSRKSRAEESPFLTPQESPKSPVAAVRRGRKSPLPPTKGLPEISPPTETSKEEITAVIEQSKELDDPEIRAELMQIIQAFIMEKQGKL